MFQNISGFPASLLLLGTISLLLFLGYELWETQQRNQVLTQRLLKLQEKVEGGSKSQEIYLSKAIKNTLVKQAGFIQPCYLNLLKSLPEINGSGKVLMDWQIDDDGKVFGAGVVRDSFGDPAFQQCLTTAISKIVFPRPPSGDRTYLEHHFLFKKKEEN